VYFLQEILWEFINQQIPEVTGLIAVPESPKIIQ